MIKVSVLPRDAKQQAVNRLDTAASDAVLRAAQPELSNWHSLWRREPCARKFDPRDIPSRRTR